MKKIEYMPVWLRKMVLAPHIIGHVAVAGTRRISAVQLQKKECNKYDLTAAHCF
jgi:hypothetical protein